jgi:hypothetical protein
MTHKGWLLPAVAVALVLIFAGVLIYIDTLPERLSQHETLVLGQAQWTPGSTAAMRIIVRDSRDATPLAGAGVKVLLRPAQGGEAARVFEGSTNAAGTLDVGFAVPEDAASQQTLIVETRSSLGSDRLEKPVTVRRDYRLLLTTDKPLYQPGQLIHLRVLALGNFDRRPAAEQELQLTVADGKGNTVFRKALTTSVYGVAAVDFQLADEVNTGPYKIAAILGTTTSEKTVTVEHYVLPKFAVVLSTDRDFYRPGDHVAGTLTARYFFGKDVTDAAVHIEGTTFDVAQSVAFTLEGQTDAQGTFHFSFELPAYIAGSELEGGRARFYLAARVTDQADHTEVGRLSLPIAESVLVIDAIPEGGRFREGVDNILYVITSYPDGTPAEADVEITRHDNGEVLSARTGAYGLAEVVLTPESVYTSMDIKAVDAAGTTATASFAFEGQGGGETVLLRPQGAIYRVGDPMKLTVLTSQETGTVYLDIVREGQTVSTRAVEMAGGAAEVVVDLTPDLYGTLELHAYKVRRDGFIIRDTRLIVVDQAADLGVSLMPGADVYKPGDDAIVDLHVSDAGGVGVQVAVGLAIVDESVFALAEQDPGFAKLVFLLEQELLEPKFELHGFSIPDLVREPCGLDEGGIVCPEPLREAREGAGKASLASALSTADPFTLEANSHVQALARAYARQRSYYQALVSVTAGFFALVPLTMLILSGFAVARAKHFWKSLGLAVGLLIVVPLCLLGVFGLLDTLWWRAQEVVAIVLGLVWIGASLLSLIILTVSAARRKDGLLGMMLGLLLLIIGLGFVLGLSAELGNVTPPDWVAVILLVAVLLLPLAYVLRGAGFVWERRAIPAVAAFVVGFLFLGILVLTFEIGLGRSTQAVGRAWDGDVALAGMPAPGLGRVIGADVEFLVEEKLVESVAERDAGTQAESGTSAGIGQSSGPPRLRQYFPETMYWLPDGITDESGFLRVQLPVADSITTWRVAALASSQDGRLGSATGALRVFQDFFIDLDLPGSLTVGDEIAVPVGVFNYLPEPQSVRLEVEEAPWFELVDERVKEIEIAAHDITVVYFRIQARDFGRQPFQVTAYGSRMSDAIRKEVRIFPDGKELRFTASDRLSPTAAVAETVLIPADAIPGTQRLLVKIYPGVVSQVVEGLDALLRMPYGCFEQTSSATYPNVLVLDYLKTTQQASPEVQMQAEQYINLGYQRLTTFEVDGEPGGFSLFGDAPADPMLTAYGLQQFSDMSRVYDVDPALISRVVTWLVNRQRGDGSWEGVEGFHETNTTNQTGRIPVTAFIVWGMADAGYAGDAATQRGVAFLREHVSEADTAYDLALVANALVAVDLGTGGISAATEAVLGRLAAMAQREGESAFWNPGRKTYMGGSGISGQLETTASAALALLRAGRQPDLTSAALTYLVRNKDSFGTWETTSATVMALKALIQSVHAGAESVDATVTVTLNGEQSKTVRVTPETFDVVQMVVFDSLPLGRESEVEIVTAGEGSLMYQIAGSYVLPWDRLARYPELAPDGEELVSIEVAYDRAELAVDDTVRVDVHVMLNEPGASAEQSIIDLGLPPGFAVETEDLARLVAASEHASGARIRRYELTGRQIILYVSDLTGGERLSFSYRLRARFPLVAQTPASMTYDYYNPSMMAEAVPLTLTVTER